MYLVGQEKKKRIACQNNVIALRRLGLHNVDGGLAPPTTMVRVCGGRVRPTVRAALVGRGARGTVRSALVVVVVPVTCVILTLF